MDAFLSYNRADAAAVATLDAWLAGQGLRCFLDTRELRAGGAWLPELERAITREAAAMLVLVGPAGLGNTQHYEYQLGLTRQAAEPAFPLIPVLLPGTPEYRFPRGFLGLQTWVNFAEGLNDPAAQQRLLAAIRRESLNAEAVRGAICPYKGLEAFQEEDGKIFFGRDAEAAQLHRTVIEHGVAAVIGRSGSGKSSLARAGLLPRLRQKSEGHWGVVWDRLVLRPGRYPLSALAEALDPPRAEPDSIEYGAALRRTADLLRGQHPDFVAELLHRRLAALDRRTDRFLILLDQAEEMFARPIELTDAQAIRDWQADTETLIALLLGAAQRGPASLVLTIRSDFFDPLQHSPMGPLLNKAMVATRGVQDLRAAVAGPAGLVGLRFSPGLEDRILRETGTDEGNLPLLQHALTRSWALREDVVITSAAYDRSGGVEQAINLAAQTAFDALGSEDQAAAKRLFLRLVRPGEGRGHVRVRAPLPEEGAQRVVAEFFGAPERRLLFFGQVDGRKTVEVAHEALIRGWPTLLAWVEENRERLATRDAVQDWIRASGGEPLPEGALLTCGAALLADPGDVAVEDISEYLIRSLQSVELVKEERNERELREARLELVANEALTKSALAERDAANRRLQYNKSLVKFSSFFVACVIMTGIYVYIQRGNLQNSVNLAQRERFLAELSEQRANEVSQRNLRIWRLRDDAPFASTQIIAGLSTYLTYYTNDQNISENTNSLSDHDRVERIALISLSIRILTLELSHREFYHSFFEGGLYQIEELDHLMNNNREFEAKLERLPNSYMLREIMLMLNRLFFSRLLFFANRESIDNRVPLLSDTDIVFFENRSKLFISLIERAVPDFRGAMEASYQQQQNQLMQGLSSIRFAGDLDAFAPAERILAAWLQILIDDGSPGL